jgi:ferredoxin
MGLRVVVDRDLCQGHGVCESEAPELFVVGRDRVVEVLHEHPPESQRQQLEMAVKYCPTHALSIVED